MLMLNFILFSVFCITQILSQHDNVFTISACSKLSPLLKPVKDLNIAELQGNWITINKASFGTDSVSTFSVDQDPTRTDFTIHVDRKDQKVPKVPDCIRQDIINLNHGNVLTKSYLFFEDPQLNTFFNTTFDIDSKIQGYWNAEDKVDENILILNADPNKYLVFAICNKYSYDDFDNLGGGEEEEENLRTTIITLARHQKRHSYLSQEEQLKMLINVADNLGEKKFLAARLDTTCGASINSINFLLSSILLVITSVYFV